MPTLYSKPDTNILKKERVMLSSVCIYCTEYVFGFTVRDMCLDLQ